MFYYVPIIDQLKLLFEKNKLPSKEKYVFNSNSISDIKDGENYKKFMSNFNLQQREFIHSFTINMDGISLSNKSPLTIWPVFLAINELPIGERYYIDNIIFAGIYFLF